jgi:dihydrofolate reductase
MTKVIVDITMGLDGAHEVEGVVLGNAMQRSGAVVMGRNLFHLVDGPDGWSDKVGEGAANIGWRPRLFIVTHKPPARVRLNHDVTFVTEGVAAALDAARAECPPDTDVVIMGGGNVIAQAIDQGLVDEMVLRVSPLLMCAGASASAPSGSRPSCDAGAGPAG